MFVYLLLSEETGSERDKLVTDDMVLVLLVWLSILSITILATLGALCYHKVKVTKHGCNKMLTSAVVV